MTITLAGQLQFEAKVTDLAKDFRGNRQLAIQELIKKGITPENLSSKGAK